MNFTRTAVILLIVLILAAGAMVLRLVKATPPQIDLVKNAEPTRSKIVAARELPAFTLLAKDDLQVRKGTIESDQPDVGKFMNRYLLTNIKKGGEVKDENLAPEGATPVLDDAVAVSVPASSTTSLGGQLRVGDLVEMFAVHSKENTPADKFEKLVVLNIVPANKETNVPGAITFAVPSSQRDAFARAVGGTQLIVTKQIAVHR